MQVIFTRAFQARFSTPGEHQWRPSRAHFVGLTLLPVLLACAVAHAGFSNDILTSHSMRHSQLRDEAILSIVSVDPSLAEESNIGRFEKKLNGQIGAAYVVFLIALERRSDMFSLLGRSPQGDKVYEQWQHQYLRAKPVRKSAIAARYFRVGANACLTQISAGSRKYSSVGRDPLKFVSDDKSFQVVDVHVDHLPVGPSLSTKRTSIYLAVFPLPTLSEAAKATESLRNWLKQDNIVAYFGPDPWFITDTKLPALDLFDDLGPAPPSLSSYSARKEVSCNSLGNTYTITCRSAPVMR